jgi:hypothetical protein
MKKKHIILIIGLLLVAFTSNAQENRYIKTDAYEGVIFAKFGFPTSELAKHPYFPSDSEIKTMEKKISDSIGVISSAYEKTLFHYKGHCDIAIHIKEYKRQYYGCWYKGNKVILTSFFKNAPENWKKEMLLGRERGGCVEFELKYSVNSGKLYDFFTDLSEM